MLLLLCRVFNFYCIENRIARDNISAIDINAGFVGVEIFGVPFGVFVAEPPGSIHWR